MEGDQCKTQFLSSIRYTENDVISESLDSVLSVTRNILKLTGDLSQDLRLFSQVRGAFNPTFLHLNELYADKRDECQCRHEGERQPLIARRIRNSA